jgi:branched-chain amino acid aminotransferase
VGNQIYTPGLSEGCIPGIMREVVIHIATDLGYQVFNKAQIDADILTKADELFLTNSVSGIKWIVGLRHKRYYGNVSRKISEHLNNITFPDQFKDGFSG